MKVEATFEVTTVNPTPTGEYIKAKHVGDAYGEGGPDGSSEIRLRIADPNERGQLRVTQRIKVVVSTE